jgi:hypothetical protein
MTREGREKNCAAVAKCLDRETLTRERVRKFSRRARRYIWAYYKIATEREEKVAAAAVAAATTGTYLDAYLDETPILVEIWQSFSRCIGVPWILRLTSARQFLSKRRMHKINTLFIIIIKFTMQ